MAWERDPARVLGALEHFANRDARALRIGAHDRGDVLIPRAEEVDEAPPDLRLEEAEELAVARVDGEEAFLLAELALGARAVLREDVRRGGVHEPEDPGLPHVLDGEPGLRPGRRRVRLAFVLEEGDDAGLAAQSDRVVGLGLQDLGEGHLRILELALLDEGAAEAVPGLQVVGRRLDDLGVQLDGAGPIGLEGCGGGLVGQGANAKTLIRDPCHWCLQRMRVRPREWAPGICRLYLLIAGTLR